MRPVHLLTCVAALLVIVAAAPVRKSVPSAARNEAAETRRIRAHFDSVLTELATRAPVGLTSVQHARRATLLDTLRQYRDRGRFPHNYDFPGRAVPYFVDRKTGTLCAVAYLLASTGRRDIVDRVAHTDNNVWVSQLAADTALARWLDANGLTLAEAARIQVPYVAQPVTSTERARNTAFLSVVPVALGGAVISSVWNVAGNADGHRRVANVLGIASGTMAIGMGAALLGNSDAPRGVGAAGVALGGVSIALATRAIRRHRDIVAAEREDNRDRLAARLSLAPTLSAGTGLTVSMQF